MCQEFPKEKWIDAQKENVLDAPYYHVVFTVPEELNSIIYSKFVWTSLMRRLRQYTTRTNQRQPGIFSTMVFKVSKVSSIWSTTCLPWLTISVICSVRGCGSA